MLAVAKEQLDLLLERFHDSQLLGLDGTDDFFSRNYTGPLFKQRKVLDTTASIGDRDSTTRVPLIFHFKEVQADGSRRSRVLVMRDVGGEDFENRHETADKLGFFKRADAVLALIDPLTVESVRERLAEVVSTESAVGEPGIPIIRHILSLMTDEGVGVRTKVPIGIALSKIDTLQLLKDAPDDVWAPIMSRAGSPLQRDPSLKTPLYDDEDGQLLHAEIVGLLGLLDAGQLTSTLQDSAETFRYFAVSALGASPTGKVVSSGGIAPFRVLDPFKWALQITGGGAHVAADQGR